MKLMKVISFELKMLYCGVQVFQVGNVRISFLVLRFLKWQLIQEKNCRCHLCTQKLGDVNAWMKFYTELRKFVQEKKIEDHVHFLNKTLTAAPYLASANVLFRILRPGRVFWRITIEAMEFQLPVLGTASGARRNHEVNNSLVECCILLGKKVQLLLPIT